VRVLSYFILNFSYLLSFSVSISSLSQLGSKIDFLLLFGSVFVFLFVLTFVIFNLTDVDPPQPFPDRHFP